MVKIFLRIYNLSNKTYIGSLGLTLTTNIFIAAIAFISGILSARLLGSTGRGELAAIQTLPTILAWIAMLGVPDALVYYSASQPEKSGRMLTTSMLMGLIFCVPFSILGFFLIPIVLSAQSEQVIHSAQQYLWLLPIIATTGMLVNPLRGRNDFSAWNLLRTFPTLLWMVLLIVMLFTSKMSVYSLTESYLIGMGLLFIPTGYIVMKRIKGSFTPSSEYVKPIINYGLPTALSMIPFLINSRLDQIVLTSVFEPGVLGLYAIAFTWSNTLKPITTVLPAVLMPHVASLKSDNDQIASLTNNIRISGVAYLFFTIVSITLAPFLLPFLFGSEFSPAIPIAIILTIAAGLLGFNQVLKAGALGLGKPKLVLGAEIVGLIVLAVMLALTLSSYRLIGAAVSSLLSYISVTILLLYAVKSITSKGFSELLFLRKDDFKSLLIKLKTFKKVLDSPAPPTVRDDEG